MIVKTKNLNQAALLTVLGGSLQGIEGFYPNNTYIIKSHPIVLWYEKKIGLIPYRKYCNQRIRLKERGRKQEGLPTNFTGKHEGFNFGEMAIVREYTKKEKQKYEVR